MLNAHLGRALRQALFSIAQAFGGPLQAVPSSIAVGTKRKGLDDVLPCHQNALAYLVQCRDAVTLPSLSLFGCGRSFLCDGELAQMGTTGDMLLSICQGIGLWIGLGSAAASLPVPRSATA